LRAEKGGLYWPMFVRLGKLLVVLLLAGSVGLHWALLQTVAWTAMLAGNLQTHSLGTAVACTFDGKHPCCLCQAIAAAKKSEKKTELAFSSQKMEFPPTKEVFVLIAPSQFEWLPFANTFAPSVLFPPPTPPPRSFSV